MEITLFMHRYLKKGKRFIRLCALLISCLIVLSCVGCEKESTDVNGGFGAYPNANKNPTQSGKKRVALTFDDGPHNVRTKKIVDELEKYGFHATFFVVGNRVASVNGNSLAYNGADAVQYAAQKGNEIGIHGYTHSTYYHTCSDEVYKNELFDTAAAIIEAVGDYNVKLMRPIGGHISEERVEECPYSVIMWSVDSLDWKYRGASDEAIAAANVETIVNNVMSKVKDGDVILMHDIYENTYEATKIILKQLYEQGYEVVTVSELFGNTLKAGQKYSQRKTATK